MAYNKKLEETLSELDNMTHKKNLQDALLGLTSILKSRSALIFMLAMVIFFISSLLIASDFLLVFSWAIFGLGCLFSIGGIITFFVDNDLD